MALVEEALALIRAGAVAGNRADVEETSKTVLAAWKTRAADFGFGSSDNQLGAAIAALQQRVWDLEKEYRSDASRLTSDGHHQAAREALQIANALGGFSVVRKSKNRSAPDER